MKIAFFRKHRDASPKVFSEDAFSAKFKEILSL